MGQHGVEGAQRCPDPALAPGAEAAGSLRSSLHMDGATREGTLPAGQAAGIAWALCSPVWPRSHGQKLNLTRKRSPWRCEDTQDLWDSWSWGPGDSEDFVSCALSLRLKMCLKVAGWDSGICGRREGAGNGWGWAGEQNRKQLWGELGVFKASPQQSRQGAHLKTNLY